MKFIVALLFLATVLTTVVTTQVDQNDNRTAVVSSSTFVDAVTVSATASMNAVSVFTISSSPAEDVFTVNVTTSTTMPCSESTDSTKDSTTTITTIVFKTTTDLITIGGIRSSSPTTSIQMPSVVVTSGSTWIPKGTISGTATSIPVLGSTSSLNDSHISTTMVNALSADSHSTSGQSTLQTSLTQTAIDAVRVFTGTSPSSVIAIKATTIIPVQYLSTFTSGSSTMTVTMTSTSTSTRIISVMINGGYISAVPFLSYPPSVASLSTDTSHLSSAPKYSQSQTVVQPHVAIATTSQGETCTPLTVYITVTGSVAGTSTVLASGNSVEYSRTSVGGDTGSRSATTSKTAITSAATSAAVYGALSATAGSTSSSSAAKPSTTATGTGVSGTGSSNANRTAPSISPFLTSNSSDNNGTATNSAGEAANRMPFISTVLAVLMAVSSMFILAL